MKYSVNRKKLNPQAVACCKQKERNTITYIGWAWTVSLYFDNNNVLNLQKGKSFKRNIVETEHFDQNSIMINYDIIALI